MVITNVTIWTGLGDQIEKGFIDISNGRIEAIGAMSDLPSDEPERLDLGGCIAIPGLVDAHSHIGLFGDGLGVEGEDGNEPTDPITPQLRAIDGLNPLDRCFGEALEYGVTTVVSGPGSANPISGQSAALKTTGICVDDMVVKAPLAMKMALGENPKETYSHRYVSPASRMATAALIREQLQAAARYKEDKERALNDPEGDYDLPDLDVKYEALLPVLSGELPVHFHAHRADDIFTAARIMREFSLKGVIIHATEGHLVAQRFAKEGIGVVCGPIIGSRSKPELSGYSRENPAIMAAHGILTAICTDHPEVPQEDLMLSAALAHRSGLTREQALMAVTSTPAALCGIADRVGAIKPGLDADIAIFDCDPLLDMLPPKAVFVNGKLVVDRR